ncbi:MAG: flavodoxin domain-containing protein [Spirochaetaceae bacterium]|nr:flavodoxin domain-containing protein [Spirochaetaceae bacterium]
MKTLLVYFSNKGHTAKVAEALAGQVDVLKLESLKPFGSGFFFNLKASFAAMTGASWPLKEYNIDYSAYERIILASPIWVSRINPLMRTFIKANAEQLKTKKLAFITVSGGPLTSFGDFTKVFGEQPSLNLWSKTIKEPNLVTAWYATLSE